MISLLHGIRAELSSFRQVLLAGKSAGKNTGRARQVGEAVSEAATGGASDPMGMIMNDEVISIVVDLAQLEEHPRGIVPHSWESHQHNFLDVIEAACLVVRATIAPGATHAETYASVARTLQNRRKRLTSTLKSGLGKDLTAANMELSAKRRDDALRQAGEGATVLQRGYCEAGNEGGRNMPPPRTDVPQCLSFCAVVHERNYYKQVSLNFI